MHLSSTTTISPDALATILYTSGTSGVPKGAMLSHAALAASIEQVAALSVPVVAPGDVVLGVLPLSHIYSLNGTLGAVVKQAATLVLVEQAEPQQSLRLIAEHGVTNVPGAPALWAAWSALPEFVESMTGVRLLFSGSDGLPAEVAARVRTLTGLDINQGYGLTEASPGVTTTLSSSSVKPGSVGRQLPGVELRLVDDDGDDIDPDDGDPGEIYIKGANLFSGYWPNGEDGPSDDGWFATGDIGFLDDEGDLFLVDRRKELIIVNGFNVYPREVESALLEHEGVVEAAAIGVPDEKTGEHVLVYVVAAPGYLLTERELGEHCEARLARFKRPAKFEIVEVLPHSATGKVAKGQLPHNS